MSLPSSSLLLLRRSGLACRPRLGVSATTTYTRSMTTSSTSSSRSPSSKRPRSEKSPPLSFSFSGAGFLAPFHVGVVRALLDQKLITDDTKLAGASAGALVAASTVVGISPEDQLLAYRKMAHACRQGGYLGRVNDVLAASLRDRFPADAHEIANGRLTVAVMQLWPKPRLAPLLLQHFSSRDDLLESLMTSSHVPLYLDWTQPLWRRFRDGLYVDGGLVDLVPPVPGAIKVCVFPSSFLLRKDLHVSPQLLLEGEKAPRFPFSVARLLRWAFIAPEDDGDIDRLYALGQEAALEWAATGGFDEGREIDVVETHGLEATDPQQSAEAAIRPKPSNDKKGQVMGGGGGSNNAWRGG